VIGQDQVYRVLNGNSGAFIDGVIPQSHAGSVSMDHEDLFECGVLWRNTADSEAGWELIRGLQSFDPGLRSVAKVLLVENGRRSMQLLEDALAAGSLSPYIAGQCMAEILREQIRQGTRSTTTWPPIDVSEC
jgi:hypothetical protein